MSTIHKDPADWVQGMFDAGYSAEQIKAVFQHACEAAPPVLDWKLDQLLQQCPKPDAMRLKQWFGVFATAYKSMTDVFIRQDWRSKLCGFFNLSLQEFELALDERPARQSTDQVAAQPLAMTTAIELELLRRLFMEQAERDWWQGREALLLHWEDPARRYLAETLALIDGSPNRSLSAMLDFRYGEQAHDIEQLLAPLAFAKPMQEPTATLVAEHWNRSLQGRKAALLAEYAGREEDPALRHALAFLKPIGPEAIEAQA